MIFYHIPKGERGYRLNFFFKNQKKHAIPNIATQRQANSDKYFLNNYIRVCYRSFFYGFVAVIDYNLLLVITNKSQPHVQTRSRGKAKCSLGAVKAIKHYRHASPRSDFCTLNNKSCTRFSRLLILVSSCMALNKEPFVQGITRDRKTLTQ